MIVNHSTGIKNLSKASRHKKSAKENISSYIVSNQAETASLSSASVNINSFLYLQEVDEFSEDLKKLNLISDNFLDSFDKIRLALIDGELEEAHIMHLINMLTKNNAKLQHPELQHIVDDIILRCEVEIAKIEAARY